MASQLTARRAVARVEGSGRGPGGLLLALGQQGSCPVPGCSARIDFSRLMCRGHWRLVPWEMRGSVWATWRSGQAVSSPEHEEAVWAAVNASQPARRAAALDLQGVRDLRGTPTGGWPARLAQGRVDNGVRPVPSP